MEVVQCFPTVHLTCNLYPVMLLPLSESFRDITGVARSGRLILFDPAKARKGAAGMLQEIAHRNRPIVEEVKDRLVDGVWPQFIKPSPLNDTYFLVAAKLDKNDLWGYLSGR